MQRIANNPLILKAKFINGKKLRLKMRAAVIKWIDAISVNLPAENLSKHK